jgi:hypothetical protein
MKTIASVITAGAILSGGGFVTLAAKSQAHLIQAPTEAQWGPHVVVVSGALTFGMGDKLSKGEAGTKTLPMGGFALMPANMNHFAYTTQETTIVLYGQGPVAFKYVDPSDDPRKTKQATQ